MTNNDILRRLRYILSLSDKEMQTIFELGGSSIENDQLGHWLKKEEDTDYQNCHDKQLAYFLNGLITKMRGPKEGDTPKAEKNLNNNLILTKLKIAFNLKAEDMLAILALADFQISKHELSAFFRRPDHKHFRACKDQVLRNFLMGLQLKYQPKSQAKPDFSWPK